VFSAGDMQDKWSAPIKYKEMQVAKICSIVSLCGDVIVTSRMHTVFCRGAASFCNFAKGFATFYYRMMLC